MLTAATLVLFALTAGVSFQPVASVAPSPVELSIAYDDGRVVRHVVTSRSSSAWTPYFPRSAEWRSAEGLRVEAINLRHQMEGEGVRVQLSLFLGRPHQREVEVADLVVDREQAVVVHALEVFGVRPVRLSVGEYVPTALYQPAVENRTTAVQVDRIDVAAEGAPGYRVTVSNLSTEPVLSFHLQTYSGGKRHLSSRRGERDGTAILPARGTHTFFVPSSRSLDIFAITGLMFEDGRVEGDAEGVATTRLVYLGRRAQLARVLALVEQVVQSPVDAANAAAALTARVAALGVVPDARLREEGTALLPAGAHLGREAVDNAVAAAMADVRRGVVSDLETAPREATAFREWLEQITPQYRTWHDRFAKLTAR